MRESKLQVEGELSNLKAKEEKKRVNVEQKIFTTKQDAINLKGELMRCKLRCKKMEKEAASQSTRREKADRCEGARSECSERCELPNAISYDELRGA